MNVKMHSDFIQLNQQLNSIQTKNGQFSKGELNIFISRLGKKLADLDTHSKAVAPLNQELRKEIKKVLSNLNEELRTYQTSNERIKDLRDQILQVQRTIDAPLLGERKVDKPKIGLQISFFCDIDGPDHNGAITSHLVKSIKQNLPFITTRSMLRATGIENKPCGTQRDQASDLERLLLENHTNWDIFQQFDSEYGEEFLVFLPKSLEPGKSGMEKLQALDFATDGSLKQVSLMDALQGPKRKVPIEAFFKLFTQEKPKLDKLFYIAGHGEQSSVAALNANNYIKFLDFLETQKCKGLGITSCYSSGTAALLNIPKQPKSAESKTEKSSNLEEVKEKSPGFKDQAKEHSFLTITRSVGDFQTYSGQEAEENTDTFFQELTTFLETAPETVPQFHRMLEKVEQGQSKSPANFVQIYFPHSAGIPGGFRAVGEQGIGFPLTYNLVKQRELESKKMPGRPSIEENPEIEIKERGFLETYPLVVPLPIRFTKTDPILLSMVPGNSHHLMKSLTLVEKTPQAFINETLKFHKSNEVGVSKSFLIGKLSSADQSFEEAVLYITPKSSQCVYREGDQYFLTDGTMTKPISAFQHALFFKEALAATVPEEAAVRASSGGQESEESFQKALLENTFWKSETNKSRDLALSLGKPAKTNEIQEILKDLSPEDKQSLVFHLLTQGYSKEAFEIFKEEAMDPSMIDLNGIPFLILAMEGDHFEMVEHLILAGTNINAQHPLNGNSILTLAAMKGNKKIIELLLSNSALDIETPGRWAAFYALVGGHLEIFKILLDKGVLLDYLDSKEEHTVLSMCMNKQMEPPIKTLLVETLLAAGADPNKGKPSPLNIAIYSNQLELVKKLVAAGGKAFEQDKTGVVPFIEALQRGSPEIVNFLLERPECNLGVRDQQGVYPAIAALFSGNREVIEALKSKNAPFPTTMAHQKDEEILKNVLYRLEKLQDYESIKEFLQWNQSQSQTLEFTVVDYFLKKNPQFLSELIELGLIDPHSKSEGLSIFFKICQEAAVNYGRNFNKYQQLINTCVKKGPDLTEHNISSYSTGHSIMEAVLLQRDSQFASWLIKNRGVLLEYKEESTPLSVLCADQKMGSEIDALLAAGADPNKGKPSALNIAIYSNQLELVKKLVAAGGKAFEQNETGAVPFIEALQIGSPEIVHFLLERPDCNLAVQDQGEVCPAIAALFSGNKETIEALRSKNAPFPRTIAYTQNEALLKNVLYRLEKLQNYESIKEFLKWNQSQGVEYVVFEHFLEHNPQFLSELIELGLINPNSKSSEGGVSIFFQVCEKAVGNFDKYQEFLNISLKNVTNINEHNKMARRSIMETALLKGNIPFAKWLLQSGVQISKEKDSKKLLNLIIAQDDVELLQFAFNKAIPPIKMPQQPLLRHIVDNLKPDSPGKIFKWLIEQETNINEIIRNQGTLFCNVVTSGNLPLVEYCLAHGADLHPQNTTIYPPMIWAATLKNDPEGKIFKKLVEAGADMNRPIGSAPAPFVSIIEIGDLELVKWCLEHGAKIDLEDSQNDTPMQAAAKLADPSILELLKKKESSYP